MRTHISVSLRAALIALASASVSATAQGAPITPQTIALSGTAAPGTGNLFTSIRAPMINNSNRVAFDAILDSPGSLDRLGIWSNGLSPSLELVVRRGDAAIGDPRAGAVISSFRKVFFNDAGNVAFSANIKSGGVTFSGRGIWSDQGGSLQRLVGEDSAAPGIAGGQFWIMDLDAFNASGAIAFEAMVKNTPGVNNTGPDTNNRGVWSGQANALNLLARSGDATPGAAGTEIGSPLDISLNDAGQSTMAMRLRDTSGNFFDLATNGGGLWSNAPGGLSLVARNGDASPLGGTYSGVLSDNNTFSDEPLNISDKGMTAFSANLTPGITDNAIFFGTQEGALTLVRRTGQSAPGIAGATIVELNSPVGNRWNQIAFTGTVSGAGIDASNDEAMWRGRPTSLRLIAREGDQVPGAPAGIVFGSGNPGGNTSFTKAIVNRSGQVAFKALISGPGGEAGEAILATDIFGRLRLLAISGGDIEVAPGDVRIVGFDESLSLAGDFRGFGNTESGEPRALNDRGRIAYSAGFTDGSQGAFMARVPLFGALDPSIANYASLTTASPVSMSQNVSVPADFTDLVFEYRFEGGPPGSFLTIMLGATELGSILAPAAPSDEFITEFLEVPDALLGTDQLLTFTVDGPAGANWLIGNVNFLTPDGVVALVNGDFGQQTLDGWITSGDVSLTTLQLNGDGTPPPASVPEPGTLVLLGFGLAGLGVMRRRRR